jgi:serine/threonine-protein kinase
MDRAIMRKSSLSARPDRRRPASGAERPANAHTFREAGTMAAIAADRDLLFGLLALQNGLIDQVQLVAAFQAWTRDKEKPLAEHLVARGDLDADQRAGIEAMVRLHVKKHGGDAAKSLAAIPVGRYTRESLARVGDARVEASLAVVGRASAQAGEDADRTTTYSVGAATSNGQRFRVLRAHARGGLGAVFVALDEELHREVALKQILDHHADDPNSRARFLLEAEITGGLEHPGIVPIYGLGAYPDGRPYYAMRFIRGDSLKEAIAGFHADDALRSDPGRRGLALLKLLRRFLAVCDAIDYAQSRGILHRDLKPSNVILGKHGETLVVDWGLAKALGRTDSDVASDERILVPSSSSGSAETLPGSALGTPAYMSPEQANGELDRLGPRSDVYSLGATLYCLLTGRPPVEDDDVGAVLRAVQKGDFPPPRRLDPAVDPALEAVCLKAMALRAEDRYPTPRALAEDIEHWMADEPVAAWREPWTRRARRWERRHRTAVMAATSAVLVALAGMFSVLVVQARANSDLSRSNNALAAANKRERERFSLAMDAVKLFHGEVSEDFLLKEKPFQELRTRLLRGAAGFYNKLGDLLAGQTDRPSRMALAHAYDELAELTDKIGSKPEALALRRKALAERRELAAASEADTAARVGLAQSWIAVGSLQRDTGDTSGALASCREARRLIENVKATAGSDVQVQAVLGQAHNLMGRLLQHTATQAEALAEFERALAIRRDLADARPELIQFQADLAASYEDSSYILRSIGRPVEALSAAERVLAIGQKLADARPELVQFQADLARSYIRAGYLLNVTGRRAEALAAFERSLALARKLAEANRNVTRFQEQMADAYHHIAWTQRLTGKLSEALAGFVNELAIRRRLAEADPSVRLRQTTLATSLAHIGGIHREAGRHTEAATATRAFLAIMERLSILEPIDCYNLACGNATLAGIAIKPGSRMTAAEGRLAAEQAMQWLHRAVARGYRNVAVMQRDPDLDPLRSRRDFQLLMMDLEFPDDPFAPGLSGTSG